MPKIEKMEAWELAKFIIRNIDSPEQGVPAGRFSKISTIKQSLIVHFRRFFHALYFFERIDNRIIAKELNKRIKALDNDNAARIKAVWIKSMLKHSYNFSLELEQPITDLEDNASDSFFMNDEALEETPGQIEAANQIDPNTHEVLPQPHHISCSNPTRAFVDTNQPSAGIVPTDSPPHENEERNADQLELPAVEDFHDHQNLERMIPEGGQTHNKRAASSDSSDSQDNLLLSDSKNDLGPELNHLEDPFSLELEQPITGLEDGALDPFSMKDQALEKTPTQKSHHISCSNPTRAFVDTNQPSAGIVRTDSLPHENEGRNAAQLELPALKDFPDHQNQERMIPEGGQTHNELAASSGFGDSEDDLLLSDLEDSLLQENSDDEEPQRLDLPNAAESPFLDTPLPITSPSLSRASSLIQEDRLENTQKQIEAASLFALMNLGSAGMNPTDIQRSHELSLQFTIETLGSMLQDKLIPENERKIVVQLIQNYTSAFEILLMQSQRISLLEIKPPSADDVISHKKEIAQAIIAKLKNQGEIYLTTGYSSEPAGHAIGLKLVSEADGDEAMVRGEIYNRGEGAEYHGERSVDQLKEKVNPILSLDLVPIKDLEGSNFLETLIELSFLSCPLKPILSEDTKVPLISQEEKTRYSIQDFYEGALPLWPGQISQSAKSQTARSMQRGGTCSLKASLNLIKESLSPTTSQHIKLKMRIDSLQKYLKSNAFAINNIPQLEWALGKMNRALEKLVKSNQATPLEIQACEELSIEVKDKIKMITRHRQLELERLFSTSGDSKDLRVSKDCQISPIPKPFSFPTADKVGENAIFSNIESSVVPHKELIEKSCEYVTHIQSLHVSAEVRTKTTKYLSLLSEAPDQVWLEANIQDLLSVMSLADQLVKSNLKDIQKDRPTYHTCTSMQLMIIAQVTVAILKRLKTNKECSPEYIDLHADRLLKLLTESGPQLRMNHPETNQRLKKSLSTLKELKSIPSTAPDLLWAPQQLFHTIERIGYSGNQATLDPVIKHVYDLIIKHPSLSKIKSRHDRPYSDNYERAVGIHGKLHHYLLFMDGYEDQKDYMFLSGDKNEKRDEELEKRAAGINLHLLLLKLSDPLLIGLAAEGTFSSLPTIMREPECDSSEQEKPKGRTVTFKNFGVSNVWNASHGLLCQAYFPWSDEKGRSKVSEGEFVRQILDRRMKIWPAEPRSVQNEQLFASRKKIMFGNTTIPPDEVEELLAITTHDDSVVPQCIHFFQQHFYRLKDPRFQALFEAFLWTRHSDGEGSILERILKDPHTTIADQLLSFLIENIDKTSKGGLLPEQLILTRVLAQVCAHLEVSGATERYQRAKNGLKVSFENLSDPKKSSPENANMIQHWIVSLYPYVKKEQDLIPLCKIASEKINRSGEKHDFENRQILLDDYALGFAALVNERLATEGRLPWWVLESDHCILLDKNPEVKKAVSTDATHPDVYEFEDQGVPTRVECLNRHLIISKEMLDHTGNTRWFSYDPNGKLPQIDTLPKDHPCGEEGWLVKGTQKWFINDTPNQPSEMVVISPKNQHVMCRITDRITKGDNPALTLSTSYTNDNAVLHKLLSLDNPNNILIWKDQNDRIQELDFPNLGIHLKLTNGPSGPQWEINHPKGYSVDLSATVPSLDPYTHYLVLVNKNRGRMVLMPQHQILPQEPTLLKLPSSKLSYSNQTELLTYRLDQTNQLIPSHHPGQVLYLIHLAFRNFDYPRVKALVTQLSLHPTEWTDEDVQLASHSWIEGWDEKNQAKIDRHPYACALRIKLRLVAKDSTPNVIGQDDLQALRRDYLVCLNQINSLSSDWLSTQDEHEILELVLKKSKDTSITKINDNGRATSIFKARRNELNKQQPDSPLDIVPSQPSNPVSSTLKKVEQPAWLLQPAIQTKMVECLENPLPIALMFRPGDRFYFNFLYYYTLASQVENKGTKAYHELMDLLKVTQPNQDPQLQFFRLLLLEAVKGTNENLPSLQDLVESAKDGTLHESLKAIMFTEFEKEPNHFTTKLTPLVSAESSPMTMQSSSQRLTREVATVDQPVTFAKPKLKRSRAISKIIRTYLREQDVATRTAQLKQELTSLQGLEKFHQKIFADPSTQSAYRRTLLGVQAEIQHFQNEIEKCNQNTYVYSLSYDKAKQLQPALVNSIANQSQTLEMMEKEIVSRIQTYPQHLQRQVDAGLIEPIGMKELIACFGCKDDHAILHANPSLRNDLAEIKSQLAQYLVHKTEWQLLRRSKQILAEALTIAETEQQGWNSVAAKNAADRVISSMTAQRAYKNDDPAFESLLVFESLADMRLRKEQVNALNTLTGDEIINAELEASTGFGKSKVVIPLWLFLTSRKDRLTMMTVPTALLADQILLLKSLLGNLFSVGVLVVNFDREKGANLAYLKCLNLQLEEAKKEKRVILTSIKSLHGMSGLALKHALSHADPKNPDPVTLELIKLRKTLSREVSNFIDESRECFDIHQRYDYAIGQPKPIEPQYCQEMGRFYSEVVLHVDIMKHWNLEFTHNPQGVTQSILTKELFEKDMEGKPSPLSSALASLMCKYMKVDTEHRDAMRDHLLGLPNERADQYIANMKKNNSEQYKLYKLCLRQIVVHLPRTLTKKCHEGYVLGPNRIAVPAHRGEPKFSSEFSKLDDLMNLTIQGNLKIDFDQETVQQYIDNLKNQFVHHGKSMTHDETYQLFLRVQKAQSLPLLESWTEQDVIKFTTYLNSPEGIAHRLQFITLWILPRITTYGQKISGTPYTLVESQYHVQAASGTPDPDMLPPRIKTIENLRAPIGNLHAIWKNSSVTTSSAKSPKALLRELISKEKPHRVIIDVEGCFRDISQQEIAQIILDHATNQWNPPINGVAYYDDASRCFIRERGNPVAIPREETSLPLDQIMVFMRQSKAIGSDTPMTATAKGWVTIGRDTTENLMRQGAGRMRGLTIGQTVDFVMLDVDAAVVKKKLGVKDELVTLDHVLDYVKMNDAPKKRLAYDFGLRLFLENLIEREMWKQIDDPKKLITCFQALKKNLIESTETDLLAAPSAVQKILSPREFVDLLLESILGPLRANTNTATILDIKAIEAAFDAHVDFTKMSQQIASNLDSDHDMVEVEHEKTGEASELQQEQDQDQLNDASMDLPAIWFDPSAPLRWDGNYTQAFQGKKAEFLGLSLYFSPNYLVLETGQDLREQVRKPSYQHVLRVNTEGKVEMLAVDLADMGSILTKMQENREQNKCPTTQEHAYYLVQRGQILASDSAGTPTRLDEVLNGDALIKAQLLGKILSADKYLCIEESRWIQNHKEAAKDILALANDYLSVWPQLGSLVSQIVALQPKKN